MREAVDVGSREAEMLDVDKHLHQAKNVAKQLTNPAVMLAVANGSEEAENNEKKQKQKHNQRVRSKPKLHDL